LRTRSGERRVHGELLKLGFEVAQSSVAKYMVKRRAPPSQGWRTFLRNHATDIAAMDLFVVPTISFDLLYAFVIVRLDRRALVWINVTTNPTAEWIAHQITEAFLGMGASARLRLGFGATDRAPVPVGIKYERSDDAGRRGRASLRCCRGCELVASSAHPCSRTGVFGSDCSSSHNSAADGEGGALPRQSRGPNSPVGSNRSPARNIRSARVSGPRSADPGCPSPGYGS
jgi:hypothetical protein